jgi:hypothetical protein
MISPLFTIALIAAILFGGLGYAMTRGTDEGQR